MTSGEVWIAKAARRATLKWKAGQNLRKKLLAEGAGSSQIASRLTDAMTTRKAMNELAEVLREK